MAHFHLAQLYPNLMNLYGDRGNLLCLQKRLEWYGHDSSIENINPGDNLDFKHIDLLFMGGGSEREQELVLQDLVSKTDSLMKAIEEGLPVLCICGAYQLLGEYYRSHEGKEMQGLGLFSFFTQGFKERLTGDILIHTTLNGVEERVVGFENHGGRTYFIDKRLQAFGNVIKGFGNNGEDQQEGIRYKNLLGSYLHGPLLPKNPKVADFFIKAMGERKGFNIDRILDDSLENYAHEQVKRKLMG
jgi:CobQ-like glutamine amidotransferase family enzyme